MENNHKEKADSSEIASIFSEEEFSSPCENKQIRHARNAMYFAAGALLLNLILQIAVTDVLDEFIWIDYFIWGAFIAGFVTLAIWTNKKPYTAIILAIILFVLFIVLNAILDIQTIFRGIIMKVIVIIYLTKAVNDAKEVQRYREMMST
jgi:peptidoglycan/LPS O-acetylase OafA/YrhL